MSGFADATRPPSNRVFAVVAIVALVATAAGVGLIARAQREAVEQRDAEIARLRAEIAPLADRTADVAAFKWRQEKLRRRIGIIEDLRRKRAHGPGVEKLLEIAATPRPGYALRSLTHGARWDGATWHHRMAGRATEEGHIAMLAWLAAQPCVKAARSLSLVPGLVEEGLLPMESVIELEVPTRCRPHSTPPPSPLPGPRP